MLCMLFAMLPIFSLPAHAAAKITETVNLSRPQKNMSGSGYYWDNRNDILTLSGLYIDTTDDYGLRIPNGATVVLEGKNYISASVAALTCPGNVTFKGNGSLILTSGDMGIYFYSTDDTTTARFLEGTYEITAAGDAIHSEYTSLSIVGGKMTINAPSADKYAIFGRQVKLYGGTHTMNNSVHATVSLEVRDVNLSIDSEKSALSSDKTLKIEEVTIASLSSASDYNGENSIVVKSAKSTLGSSILFGENVPMFVDVLIALLLLALIAAGIAVPFIRSYRSGRKARAALEAADAAADAKKKA